MKQLFALILAIFAAQCSIIIDVTTVLASTPNNVSGVVFYDENRDGIQSLNEEAVPYAEVQIQSVNSNDSTNLPADETLTTDENGYFNIGELAYGEYYVWSEINGRASVKTKIEINEINGTALVNIGIPPAVNLWLPLICN
ncbi:MAG: SdrD B-like domain-containing protein [Chloroflexota bacterium]